MTADPNNPFDRDRNEETNDSGGPESREPYEPPKAEDSFTVRLKKAARQRPKPVSLEGCFQDAWRILKRHPNRIFLMTLAMVLVTLPSSFTIEAGMKQYQENPESLSEAYRMFSWAGIFKLSDTLFEVGMTFGLALSLRGKPLKFLHIFSGWRYVYILPLLILISNSVLLLSMLLLVRQDSSAFFGLFLFIPGIFMTIGFSQAGMVLLDRRLSFASLKESWILMLGQFFPYILLNILLMVFQGVLTTLVIQFTTDTDLVIDSLLRMVIYPLEFSLFAAFYDRLIRPRPQPAIL